MGAVVEHAAGAFANLGDAEVEVGAASGDGEGTVAAHDGKDAGFDLGGVCDGEHHAFFGADGGADVLGDLHGAAAVPAPAAGCGGANFVGGVEAVVGYPGVEPVPAVGGVEAGEAFVVEQGADELPAFFAKVGDGVGPFGEFPLAGGGDRVVGCLEGFEDFLG